MLIEVPEKVANKIVVKRDGKKVEFDKSDRSHVVL